MPEPPRSPRKRKRGTGVVAPTPTSARCIIVAIDFGTTFTGVAWAQSARVEVQTCIDQWPDASGSLNAFTSHKVPTEIVKTGSSTKWGFEINESEKRYQWFKLSLDSAKHGQDLSLLELDYPDPKALRIQGDNVTAGIELTKDYLTCIQKHINRILVQKLGSGLMGTTPLQFVLTVPAMWDDGVRARLQYCAQQAGMGETIQMISEPEAAVAYVLDTVDPHNFQVGDKFVLCDAGGGTVDLITYILDAKNPRIKVHEAVPGAGQSCGSTFLNRIFRRWFETKFASHQGFEADTCEDAVNEFETSAKRNFDGQGNDMILRVAGLVDDPAKGVKRQKLTIPCETVKSLFEPVMAAITTLIKSQLQQSKDAKAVILVGGFGKSPYLRSCIQRVIGDGVEIIQPPYGWTAVVRGALLRGISGVAPGETRVDVTTRVARRAYGTVVCEKYEESKHAGQRKLYWDSFEGDYRTHVMDWEVMKGDILDPRKPIKHSLYVSYSTCEGAVDSHEVEIYQFNPEGLELPPKSPTPDVMKLVTLNANLSSISDKIQVKKGADGDEYYYLSYQIKTTFFSAHMEFSLWYKGKEYGKVKAEYA